MNDRHDSPEDRLPPDEALRLPAPDEALRLPAPDGAGDSAPPTQWSDEDSDDRKATEARQESGSQSRRIREGRAGDDGEISCARRAAGPGSGRCSQIRPRKAGRAPRAPDGHRRGARRRRRASRLGRLRTLATEFAGRADPKSDHRSSSRRSAPSSPSVRIIRSKHCCPARPKRFRSPTSLLAPPAIFPSAGSTSDRASRKATCSFASPRPTSTSSSPRPKAQLAQACRPPSTRRKRRSRRRTANLNLADDQPGNAPTSRRKGLRDGSEPADPADDRSIATRPISTTAQAGVKVGRGERRGAAGVRRSASGADRLRECRCAVRRRRHRAQRRGRRSRQRRRRLWHADVHRGRGRCASHFGARAAIFRGGHPGRSGGQGHGA